MKNGTYGCPYVPRKFAEAASGLLLCGILGLVEFGGKRLQIDGQGELPVEDGALDLGGLAQLHMEELFKALHDGGEGGLFPREGTDGLVYVKGSEEFFEFDKIGIPVQRRLDLRGR